MEQLRLDLAALSTAVPSLVSSGETTKSHIAVVAPNLLALLHAYPDSPAELRLLSLTASVRAPASARTHQLPLPASAHPPSHIVPAEGMFAVVGPSSVCVIDGLSALNTSTPPLPRRVAFSLFQARPALRVLHAAWSPVAPGFLMLLTSDASLRLYDVLAPGSLDVERWRLRVVTAAAPPVSFAFGRGPGWDALAVYVLAEDGKVYVAAPVAPVGTRLPRATWLKMHREAVAVVEKERSVRSIRSQPTSKMHDPFAAAPDTPDERDPFAAEHLPNGKYRTPRRLLDFSGTEEADGFVDESKGGGGEEPWGFRQSQMQRRFLEHVFAPSNSGDVVATREFKPAPLLFQGPLYTEHDDLDECEDDEASGEPAACRFCSLDLLQCGAARPPVLLRTTVSGEVSVLIGLEKVEAQWFLSSDSFASTGETMLEASEEYAQCAQAVAPLLLCFEHFSFGNDPVQLYPLGGKTDADVVYAATRTSVYSLRLSFMSAITDAGTLESTPKSSVSELLTIATPELSTRSANAEKRLLGLAPWYAKGQGPVALVVSSDGALHVSDPLRWITGFENSWPPRLLGSEPSSDLTWTSERPLTGSRAFACPEFGKEVMETMHVVQTLQGEHGGRLVAGTLGEAGAVSSYSAVLNYLEKRLEIFVGGPDGPGIGDSLKALADVLNHWSGNLQTRASSDVDGVSRLQTALSDVEMSEHSLRMKLGKVEAKNAVLSERIRDTMKKMQKGSAELSTAELERYKKLKDKKRRLLSLRSHVAELGAALEARKRSFIQAKAESYASAGMGMRSPMSHRQRSNRWSASPSWRSRDSPLSRRGTDWSPQTERIELSGKELKEIKDALEKHGADIGAAMELSSKLWKRLSTR